MQLVHREPPSESRITGRGRPSIRATRPARLTRPRHEALEMNIALRQDGASSVATGTPPALEITGVSKHFGSIQALTGVSLTLAHGEVVGLMGDNGAGKS